MGEGVGGAPLDRGSILDICPVLKRKTYSPLFTVKEHLHGSGVGAFGLMFCPLPRGSHYWFLARGRTEADWKPSVLGSMQHKPAIKKCLCELLISAVISFPPPIGRVQSLEVSGG